MDLQYISDSNGRHTAVIIPIEEWENLKANHQDLTTMEKPKAKPSDFFGTLSNEEGEKMQDYVTKSRNEWKRDF